MPSQNTPVEPSAFHELQRRVTQLERETSRDAGRKLLTVDRFTTANLPAPTEGQLAIETADDTFKYYANQEWRTVATGGPISALGVAGARSQAMSSGSVNIMFDSIYRNDTSFGYEQVTSGRAQYITISTEGWYHCKFNIFWDSDFSASDFPIIRPTCYVGGFQDILASAAAVYWDDTGSPIYGEQLTTAEMDHHLVVASVLFNFSTSDFGESDIGIGMRLDANVDRTKSFGGQLAITRLGDLLTSVTIT